MELLTNAIDCGIFLDCFYDLKKIVDVPNYLSEFADKIFHNYAYEKLQNRSLIHNQYLWLLTGFSRSVKEKNCKNKSKYIKLILSIVDSFFLENKLDGSCPYSNLTPDQKNISPYYHSRCLAFVRYSLENIAFSNELLLQNFYRGALFLAKMYKNDGIKALSLETKRYYFHNEYEIASFPFDIYVFEMAYKISNKDIWLELASNCINKLYESINSKGSQLSKSNPKFRDWQCNIMRNTHHSWLSRLDIEFLKSLDKYIDSKKNKNLNVQLLNLISTDQSKFESCLEIIPIKEILSLP